MDMNEVERQILKKQNEEIDREYDKFNAFLDIGGFDFEWHMYEYKERIDNVCRSCGNRKTLRELLSATEGMCIEQAIDYCERAIG